ncbi:MAG: protoporphyrinogen oxidase [Actinomycetota bacterium]|nr:protoporphyrinogen oxidase [Actinomycetota bacterium]
MNSITDVVVIGGGFSGLFHATHLDRVNRDVLLVEASPQPGGIAGTIIEDGFVLEPGAGTFMLPHRALTPILDAAGVAIEETSQAAELRYVWMRGGLVAIPYSPRAMLTAAISIRGKARMAVEPLIRRRSDDDSEESLHGFLSRRLGREAGRLLAHVAASGVYAGDPDNMSAAATFPLFSDLEAEAGSIMRGGIRRLRALPKPRPPKPKSHVPVGGMSAAARTMAASLGERYRADFPVTTVVKEGDHFRIEGPETLRARSVVIALRPDVAAAILPGIDTEGLHGWPSSPVVVIGIGGTVSEVPLPDGFGFLTGPDVEATILGCLFESSFSPRRAAPGHALAKVIVGGARNPQIIDQPDDEIVAAVVSEMERALGTAVTPSWVKVVRNREGIPQYDLEHRRRLASLENVEAANRGLVFVGWGYRGIGVAHLATEALKITDRIE